MRVAPTGNTAVPPERPLPHEIWIVLLLIVANGVFSAAEMAIVSLRKSRVNTLVEAGRAGARSVRALRDKPEGFLATVQIGITVVGSTASAFGGASIAALVMPHLVPLVGDASGEVSLALVVVGISFLSIILGELVPKSLALRMGEPYALLIAKPLLWMSMLLRPVVWLLTGTSNLVLRLFGDRTSFTETRMSLEEVRSVVEDAGSSGSIDVQSSEMAARALELSTLMVGDVMVPRAEVAFLWADAGMDELKEALIGRGHRRVPVVSRKADEVVGYVSSRDVLARLLDGKPLVLAELVRPAHHVPGIQSATQVIKDLQARKQQLAVVVDEHGVWRGLVTMQDLVEEVVGEIFNEHDHPRGSPLVAQPDGSWLARGAAPLRDVNRTLGVDLPEGQGFATVGGLCVARAGVIPAAGTVLVEGLVTLRVEESEGGRVRMVRLTVQRAQDAAGV